MSEAWLLLSDARSKLLKWWCALSAPIFVIILWQMTIDKYIGIEKEILLWVALILLPGLILLILNIWLNLHPAKLINPKAEKILLGLVIFYLGMVMYAILVSQSKTEEAEIGFDQYFKSTYVYLLPINALVLTGIGLFFYKKEAIFRPNPKILTDTAGQEALSASKKGYLQRARCYELMANNKLKDALEMLKDYFQKTADNDNFNATILLQGQLAGLTKDTEMQLVEPNAAQMRLNKIAMAILNFILEVKE
jgi:Effector-associated domain 11